LVQPPTSTTSDKLQFRLAADQFRELSPKALGLVAVGADLCGARATFCKHVLNQDKASNPKEQVIHFGAEK
jgi:hypothetical protein